MRRDDVEIDAVLARGGWGIDLVQDALAFECEFLALELDGGKFLDGTHDISQGLGAWVMASEIEGMFMEEVDHGALDAGTLGDVGLFFHIGDGIENGLRGADGGDGAKIGPKTAESPETDFKAQAFGRG
jgi:hypothetical protein